MEKLREVLKKYWGYSDFRPAQVPVIHSIMQKQDTLALLPTGGGKSICFQAPVLAQKGLGLVISPLIALMKDQVEQLKRRGIPAAAITSELRSHEVETLLNHAIHGQIRFLYVSPERLKNEVFLHALPRLPVVLLAVDEAHCISQWGYDFRPAYLEIAEIRPYLPGVPCLALTATATPDVVEDIQIRLKFSSFNVCRNSFARPNLHYWVEQGLAKKQRVLHYLREVPGTAIIYARNRGQTRELATWLSGEGISATFYHAGLTALERQTRQDNWIQGKIRVMVATNAFGMGIDKPDVRLVLHMDLPDSPEAYFQEAGRGGRDEKNSMAVLLVHEQDRGPYLEKVNASFPPVNRVREIYEFLMREAGISQGYGKGQLLQLQLGELSKKSGYRLQEWIATLQILSREGYWELKDGEALQSTLYIPHSPPVYRNATFGEKENALKELLPRMYGGIFEKPVKIRESELARRLGFSQAEVMFLLKKLAEKDLWRYRLGNAEGLSLLMLAERMDSRSILLSESLYYQRKKVALEKAAAMLDYALDGTGCRTNRLLRYFGEEPDKPCGTCDICAKKNKNDSSIESGAEMPLKELLDRIPVLAENNYALFRKYLDEGKLERIPGGKIRIKMLFSKLKNQAGS